MSHYWDTYPLYVFSYVHRPQPISSLRTMTETISSYELLRHRNIARNQEFLSSIGISTRKSHHVDNETIQPTASKKRRKLLNSDIIDEESGMHRRRSSRISALAAEAPIAWEYEVSSAF